MTATSFLVITHSSYERKWWIPFDDAGKPEKEERDSRTYLTIHQSLNGTKVGISNQQPPTL